MAVGEEKRSGRHLARHVPGEARRQPPHWGGAPTANPARVTCTERRVSGSKGAQQREGDG